MKGITFYNGEETKPVVEGLGRFKDSLFHDYLKRAINLVERHLAARHNVEDKTLVDIHDNNIVAFIGERGSGKTSCMYSLIKCLSDISNGEEENTKDIALDYIKKEKLSFLKSIDPSFFDINHNILEMVIGEMYSDVGKFIENEEINDAEQIQRLLKKFGETKRDMHYIGKDIFEKEPDQELEELQYLSSGVNLRETFKELIDSYLNWKKSKTLVISIDDIDLNTQQAYPMVEQIRKYLILPNVIILIAVKLDQLSNVIKQEMMKRFSKLIDSGGQAMGSSEISEMAERYLNKLLPIESRIYLPTPETYFDAALTIKEETEVKEKFTSVREAIPALIFRKCRYLFYNTKGTTSYIVPRNLRDLRLLIQMLMKMDDYVKVDNDKESPTYINKTQFKRYFFDTWLNSLDTDCQNVAKHLIEETEPALFNKRVIDLLKNLYDYSPNLEIKQKRGLLKEQESTDKENNSKSLVPSNIFNDIVNGKNIAYNVSLGDTFHILDYVERIETNENVLRLIFFIKSLYSIKLYEYYDELTARETQTSASDRPYRGEKLENIANYEKLVGGAFFCLNGDDILPTARESSVQNREIRLVNGNELFELIKEIEKQHDKGEPDDKVYSEDFLIRLKTVEFFMLTISRYVWSTNKELKESGIHKYRLQPQTYYDRKFDNSTKNLMFDALEPFFTMIDIQHAYGRFSEKIYTIAKNVPDSLYNKLKALEKNYDRSFLSMVCIRNSEILDDLFLKLRSARGSYRKGNDDIIIKDLYANIARYSIASYDKGNNSDNYYKITYPAFKILSDLFTDNKFVSYFNTIYKRKETTIKDNK